jgi:hypothetical protein
LFIIDGKVARKNVLGMPETRETEDGWGRMRGSKGGEQGGEELERRRGGGAVRR